MAKDGEGTPKHGIKPETITKPQQLAAAVLVAGIALGGCFIGAARVIEQPAWAAGAFVLAAIVSGLGGISAAYRLLTKHRDAMQDDVHYAKSQAAKRKELEARVKEQKEQISQQEKLAEQRLSITLEYFDVVSRELNLAESERARLRRALRETIRADEDRTLQHQAKNLLLETDEALARARFEQPALMGAVLNRIQYARYEHLSRVYDNFVREDIKSVDLAVELQRVCGVLVPARSDIAMPSPPIFVQATLGILEVVLSEVLMNARDYSPPNSSIAVEVARVPNAVLLVVKNSLRPGDVVSEDWFSPGYRGEASTEAAASGAGLGLPLVRRLLSLIGGNAAMSQEGSHARMTITFRD